MRYCGITKTERLEMSSLASDKKMLLPAQHNSAQITNSNPGFTAGFVTAAVASSQ